jgi:hypothetical protein
MAMDFSRYSQLSYSAKCKLSDQLYALMHLKYGMCEDNEEKCNVKYCESIRPIIRTHLRKCKDSESCAGER